MNMFSLSSFVGNTPNSSPPSDNTVLYHHQGRDLHNFTHPTGEAGLYTIEIRALESDTYVRLYASNRFPLKDYPVLPKDDSVTIKRRSRKGFSVEWNPSPQETPFDSIIEYHIAVNRKRPFDTYCSLMSHLQGDTPPRQTTSFEFPEEIQRNEEFRAKANPIKPAKKNEITYLNLGAKTKFTFNGARPGRKYFVNVFVYNKQNKKAVSLKSLVVRTKPKKGRSSSVKRIKNGRTQIHIFKKPKESLTMEFRIRKPAKEVLLGVHVCGKVRFQIRTKKKKWFSRRVNNYKEFTLKDLPKDTYTIKIKGSKKGGDEIRFTLTTKKNKYKYPRLPKETSVTSVNTTCENVTIEWIGETQRQTFCVYKTEISEEVAKRRPKTDQCASEIDKASEEVFCKRFRNHQQQRLRESVKGLHANRNYRIDVIVKQNKRSKLFVRYDSLYVKTAEACWTKW